MRTKPGRHTRDGRFCQEPAYRFLWGVAQLGTTVSYGPRGSMIVTRRSAGGSPVTRRADTVGMEGGQPWGWSGSWGGCKGGRHLLCIIGGGDGESPRLAAARLEDGCGAPAGGQGAALGRPYNPQAPAGVFGVQLRLSLQLVGWGWVLLCFVCLSVCLGGEGGGAQSRCVGPYFGSGLFATQS